MVRRMIVSAVLVSHGGARWLPAVLEGIAGQSRPVDRIVAVDTGSKDDSADLLRQSLGDERVLSAPRSTAYGDAVRQALGALPAGGEDEWIWLLHDDSNPAHDALEALLAGAAEFPDAAVLGPKLREWPSLRRLLEVGVTISGTGRRETGLERGEYDQGQHDEPREVLAVNTAGMLVRRRVLEDLGGFDDALPVFGNDLDFGWRAADAGHRTLVIPQAVVFHAEAAHRGLRTTPLTGRHTHFQERRSALWTLLANSTGPVAAWQVVRLFFGTVLRALGLLVTRRAGQALDELAALGSVYGRPGRLLAARRARAAHRTGDRERTRSLLAPAWTPYRHGLDSVSEAAAALSHQAQDVAERRRSAAMAADAGVPVVTETRRERRDGLGEEDEDLTPDDGWLARLITSPVAIAVTVFLVAVLVTTRGMWRAVSGGALPAAPEATGDWWRLWTETWHPLAQGSDVPAPAYLPLLAMLSWLTGSPAHAVTALMVLALPFACWGAWRLLRVAGHLANPLGAPRWLLIWGSIAYALVPATSGAWVEGRIGTVAAAALLPWLAHAALGFADPDADRRRRAGWRTGLLLALTTAFAPVAWVVALVLTLVLLGIGAVIDRGAVLRRSVLLPAALTLGLSLVLLLPWWLPTLLHHPAGGLLVEPGFLAHTSLSGVDLLTGVAGEHAAPFLPGLVLMVLAVAALVPSATRIQVLVVWVLIAVAAVTAAILSLVPLHLGGADARVGLGFPVVLIQGLAVVAIMIAGTNAARRIVRGTVSRVTSAVVATLLFAGPVAALVWFAGASDDVLGPTGDDGIPAYMEQSAELGPAHGILVVDGTLDEGLEYSVRRGDGVTIGEPEIEANTRPDEPLQTSVTELLTRPTAARVKDLADRGIEYVVLRAPADPAVAGLLDSAPGLSQASAENRQTRAWQVGEPLAAGDVRSERTTGRTVLLLLQGAALVVALIGCLPSVASSRTREES